MSAERFPFTEKILEYHRKIAEKRPVIQCITNIVTVNDCANILLALGASPTMAHHPAEVEEVQSLVSGLVLNLGATDDLEAMLLAGKTARACGHPIVLDPVGVSVSSFRRHKCLELIREVHPTAIRGNHSEIRALIENMNTASGIDDPSDDTARSSGDPSEDEIAKMMRKTAAKWDMILIASGKADIITDGNRTVLNMTGSPMMKRVTGSGCMSSALLCGFLAADPSFESAAAAMECMGLAGEYAHRLTEETGGGTMTFRDRMIDVISLM